MDKVYFGTYLNKDVSFKAYVVSVELGAEARLEDGIVGIRSTLGARAGGDKQIVSRATDTDQHVGARIRERRVLLGLSQQQMAELIGVTYQQAHKYERGINRISAGRLYEIAQVLRVPIGHFFEGLGGHEDAELPTRQRMCLEVARNFAQIDNERHQEALSQMARALAAKQ